MNDRSSGSRIFVGGLMILLGLLLFFSINDMIDFRIPHVIFSWPFILFIIGILILVNSRNRTLGVLMVVIGGFFLIPRIFPWIYFDGALVFPIVLIALGIAIIIRHRRPEKSAPGEPILQGTAYRKDFVDDVAIFGGGQKIITSENFRGGNITAIFGGSEIDLTRCRLAEGENILDILTIFGGTEIFVPRDWHVIVNVTPLFGGFSNKIIRDPSVPLDTTRTLVIKGLCMFGGGELKTRF